MATNQEHRDPESQKARDNTYNMLIEHTLNLTRIWKHHVDAVLGTTYQHHEWEGLWASRLNFPMLGNGDYLTVLNAGQSNQQNTNSISENAMISYLGRVNYIYDDKYYLTATFRRDGTSRLAKEIAGVIFLLFLLPGEFLRKVSLRYLGLMI